MTRSRSFSCRRPFSPPLAITTLGLLVVLVGPGCVVATSGPALADFAPAHGPHGVTAHLRTSWGHVYGELLEVTEGGLWVLERSGVSEVAWRQIHEATFEDLSVRWVPGRPPGAEDRERLRMVSRYVAGLSDEHRERLLRHHRQDAPRRYTPEGPDRSDPEVALFIDATRRGLERYLDPAEATLVGYRPLGPDFPGMGEHWLNPYFVIRSGVDPMRPAILTYLMTPEGRILTGAAFLQVLGPGEAPPDLPFPGAWHHHSGTVDEEILALDPSSVHHAGHDDFRVSMLHLWAGLENPGGIFAQDNWAIPFVRLGLPAPHAPTPAAGKALFLASGGDAYYRSLVGALAGPEVAGDPRLVEIVARHRVEVERLLDGLGAHPTPPAVEALVPELETRWALLWNDIRSAVGPEVWKDVGVLGH